MVLLPRPGRNPTGLGWSPFARHYLGNHYCFLLLTLLRCFSSSRSPPDKIGVKGLSHSEIHGSTLFCSSPWLIAALHVLHRLCMPRHPPCALSNFMYTRRSRPKRSRPAATHTRAYTPSYFMCCISLAKKPAHATDALLYSTTLLFTSVCQRSQLANTPGIEPEPRQPACCIC